MAIKKALDIFMNEHFTQMNLEEAVGDRFGRYSKYIIQERAIPDIRDGLKPVQRRILYAMNSLGITHQSTYKKSAKICGEVMGKYHPHGDSSIYEAMVRMSQDWKMGLILIDMHGNNGSIDGDGPAAMRYTEARLSKNASFLLKDIDKDTVPFIPNFDEEEMEPTILPAKFPNLLVNGSTGISSGYATNIPPHNINEVLATTIYLIDHPNMTIDELLEIMPGPDFPTGGTVEGKEGIKEAFLSGNGKIIIRSNYHIEDFNKDQKRIVIDEIPYDTNKSQTVEKIETLRRENKIPDLLEVRDESDREGLRIALDLKKDANEKAILNYLFKNTDLQINYKYNMVSICNRRPMCLGVIPILNAYLNHQKEVYTNRTNFELNKARKREHIVCGLIKMIDIVDEVIKTIRASKNRSDAKENIMKNFDFTDLQAEAIITMQLYRLSNTDIMQLKEEQVDLNNKIKLYEKILSSEKELLKVIKKELSEVNEQIKVNRRTKIIEDVTDLTIDDKDLISKEQVIVTISKEGYLKRVSLKSYNASKNNFLKENDATIYEEETNTINTLLMFTNMGNFIFLPVYKVPECKMKDAGTFINNLVQIDPKEQIIEVFSIEDFKEMKQVLLVTNQGSIKQMMLESFIINRYTKSVRAMKLDKDETLASVCITNNPLEILVATKNGEALRFRQTEVPLRDTTHSGGIRSIGLKGDDKVVKALYTNREEDILVLTNKGTIKRMKVEDIPLTRRSRAGNTIIKKNKSNPTYIKDVETLNSLQYKEDVTIDIMYKNGNDEIKAFDLKYNVSEIGKSYLNDLYQEPLKLRVHKASKEPNIVSGDYLIEEDTSLFTQDEIMNEKPLKVTKPKYNILDDLDQILESNKEVLNDDFITKDEVKMNIVSEERNLFNTSDNDVKIEETNDEITKTTRGSVIIRKKLK